MTVLAFAALSLAAAQLPLNPPNYYLSQLPELVDGATLEGELTADDGQNFKDGSYLDVYVLYGVAGEQVRLTARSADFDTYLTVYDPMGYVLDANDDDWNGYGSDSALQLDLPETGRYLVIVSGYGPFDMGRYVVERGAGQAVTMDAIEITVPSVQTGMLDPGMGAAPGTWGGPGQVYAFDLERPALLVASLTSFDFDTVLYVMDESGTVVAENDDAMATTDSQAMVDLEPGRYFVVASSWSSDSGGAYTLELNLYVPLD
ncbi:MAG: PPC domain-containing protein [Trueperaceae bacterium]